MASEIWLLQFAVGEKKTPKGSKFEVLKKRHKIVEHKDLKQALLSQQLTSSKLDLKMKIWHSVIIFRA
jgi:hypothetical protein